MESRYANLEQCKNYLIQFFYKTNKRYSCTRTKIGKLLSILAFKYATMNIILFWEDIYRYPDCGTVIHELVCTDRDIYRSYSYKDGKKKIAKYELKNNDIPEEYQKVSELSSLLKRDIEDIFYNFGAYSQSDLSDVLNPIVEYEGICNSEGIIDLEKIILLRDKLPDNEVIKYIFK